MIDELTGDATRAEGKHHYVYMVADAAGFLRIFYAKVKTLCDDEIQLSI